MTKKEMLTKVMEVEGCTDEMREVATKMIEALDKKSSKPTKAQIENEGIKTEIRAVLGVEPKTARQIADETGYTVNKVAALLKQIEGVVKVEGKGKNPATYTIAE
jgi:predicted Rossmann fold nucleotide-binding protein DprA/Smf involved in DNA uptake